MFSLLAKIYHWDNFINKHYYDIKEKHQEIPQDDIIDYLWKWFNAII